MDIIWDNPTALYFLWLVVPVAFLLIHAHRRRIRAARRFADPAMVERLMPALSGSRPWVRGALVVLALLCFGVALARPRWGVFFETVHQRGADVMVLLDVSRSMLAKDVAPDRLARAKSDIRDLLRKLHGERVGLIVFAGKPVVACPLTTDQGFFRFILDDVGPDSAPRGGTAIGDAIREGLRAMEERRDRDQAMLLITDGEDHDSYPREAAAAAAERRVKIFTVGLGDPTEGERVPVEGPDGSQTYLKYKGQVVWTKMDERLLQEIALTTGGAYVPAKTQVYDLGEIYESHLSKLAGGEISAEKRKRYRERFQLFLALGLALLLAELILGPYPRRETGGSARGATSRRTRATAGGAAALSGVLLLAGLGGVARASDAADLTRQGIAHFEAGRLSEALDAFKEADVSRPENRTIAFDMALSRHAMGDLDEAAGEYDEAAAARDPALSARAHYNLGNLAVDRARAVFGEQPEDATAEQRQEGLGHLRQAVLSYRACLELEPDHEKARHNLEVIRLWIKNMTDLWAKRDQQKARDEMDLMGFLEMLMRSQKEQGSQLRDVSRQEDSPRRRQQTGELAHAQRRLIEEIEPLKSKLDEALEKSAAAQGQGAAGASSPGPPGGGAADDKLARARTALEGLADQAADAMRQAADDIEGTRFEGAAKFQKQSYGALDQIWRAFAPFQKVLEQAVTDQRGVRDATVPLVETEPAPTDEPPDLAPLGDDETRVAELADLLPVKADQMGPQLDAMQQASPRVAGGATPSGSSAQDQKAREAAAQVEAMRRALEKARDLAPRAAEQARGAVADLAAKQPEGALPKEEEALKLLEEIAKEMPKNPQDQKNQDQKNKDDKKKDSKQSQNQKKDQQKQSRQSPQQSRNMSPEQVKSLLRKAEERQREAKDRRRRLLRGLAPPSTVERDW